MPKTLVTTLALLAGLCFGNHAFAAYDFHASTPEGSWQLREEIRTNHKGKQTVQVIRSSLVGKETVNNVKHYWLEIEVQEFKIKKDKRKKKGKPVIVKSLIPSTHFDSHLGGAFDLKNVRGIANKMIIQNGKQKPIMIEGSGFLADSMLKFMGAKLEYSYTPVGKENVGVPAGNFSTEKISAQGKGSAKILIKRITIDSTATLWLSEKMPFGLVKSESTDIINGKKETAVATVLEFGTSGAVSKITEEPTVMSGSLMGNN